MDRDTIGDLADSAPLSGDDSNFSSAETSHSFDGKFVTDKALVVEQGKHRFYSLVLPSDLLGETCMVEPRNENPIDGFQRLLDERRAKSIARYIDAGFGTVPGAVVLSAQSRAHLRYDRATGALTFRKDPRSFLIIDGQHRVYGFKLAKNAVSVPVVIYNRLTRAQECRLFMDINTKQRPVPNELLLDIRRLSEVETEAEALMHNVFDLFHTREDSALAGYLSPAERRKGRISRVTFNAALRSIRSAFVGAPAEEVYAVLNAYMRACRHGLGLHGVDENIANPVLFKTLMLLFVNVAERVADRHGGNYTVRNFEDVLIPFFRRLKKSDLPRAGMGHLALHEHFSKALSAGFLLKQWLFA
ncbi:DGQHR domain-containing protein [Methylocystis sp. WRRC1]|uniref:DGQHR domain-containing protein n=1 Tax=unclassified Methylocystis TaxID=2625913 RepID=UPI0001F88029|nr:MULTISPECIES: DGQHR domain-containing protein [unclassified Methylocystis]MCC3246596.1 DGQHR domain-containing protein [Methylocystis sp. WRRC1]